MNNLFYRDVYLYDIEACHTNLLKSIGFDIELSGNKLEKNIQIGKLQNLYPNLKTFLRDTTLSILNTFKKINEIQDNEIILEQYDGILVNRILKPIEFGYIKIYLRTKYDIFLMSYDRKSYIAVNFLKNEYVIKGVPNKYLSMENFLKKIIKINFNDKYAIFQGLENLKKELINGKNIDSYLIEDGENYSVVLKEYGKMQIGKSMKKLLDVNEIDTNWYFNYYVSPFTKSIIKTFI